MSRVAALWDEWADEETLGESLASFGGNTFSAQTFPDSDLDARIWAFMGADPTANPGTWPVPVDLTSRLLNQQIQIRRGRSSNQKTLSSGQATFELNDSDGYLTPQNPNSPYFGQWDIGMPMSIDLYGVGASPPCGRFRGYIVGLESRMQPGVGGTIVATVRVTLGGVVRRLTQGSVPKSAMLRSLSQTGPVAYWPMESGTEATLLASAIDRNFDATVPSGVLPGESAGPDGSAGAATVQTLSSGALTDLGPLLFPVGTYVSTGTVLVTLHVRQDLAASASVWATTAAAVMNGGTIGRLIFYWSNGGVLVTALDFTGTPIGSNIGVATTRLIEDGNWHEVQLLAVQSGANVNMTLRIDGVVIGTGTKTTQTLGTVTGLGGIAGVVDSARPSVDLCHVLMHTSDVGSFVAMMNGYPGEAAHTRFARVCGEEGIPYAITASESQLCGPQPVADVVGVVQDLETVDEGMLYELVTDWGLGYRAGYQRINLAPAMTINLATYRVTDGQAQDVLTPVRNDQRIRNEWVISRPNGGSATYKDTAHQAKKGRYDDSAPVNTQADSDLAAVAQWRVHKGTDDTPRYATMPVDLAANNGGTDGSPNLLSAWLNLQLGDRVDRVSNPVGYSVDGVAIEVEGYSETLTRRSWAAGLNVEPYEPWRVQVAGADLHTDDSAYVGWLDYDSCSLASGVDAVATSWSITCSPADSSDSNDFPRRHYIEGELITVTASTGGTSPTWTVTRSGNGVVKSHTSGVAVTLADPVIASLL